MLLDKHKKSLLERVGYDMLSSFMHLIKLTIMFKHWLDLDKFSKEELEVANQFLPILIQILVNNVKRKKNGMRLPKRHQLHDFVEQIYNFGSASNISGRIGQTHLKEKVKIPSETTRMESHNIECQTAIKDTDQCLIHKADCELVNCRGTI